MTFLLSVLNPETGLMALILAIFCWSFQAVSALLAATTYQHKNSSRNFLFCSQGFAFSGAIAIFLSMAALLLAFACNDFSLSLVAENSESHAPMIFRFAGSWGNHNGSLLLWLSLLGLCNYAASRSLTFLAARDLHAVSLFILGLICSGLGALCLFTSSPFQRLFPAPMEGSGLNPLLLDPGLACHPPLLYSGYVSFAVPFALTIAALWTGHLNKNFLILLRKWALLGWCLLSGGILLGAWWAYGTLGWGGYWFWDPVENASLMPWLMATALLHTSSLSLQKQRMICWSFALSLACFILSLMATFLVRSGIMNSVHSFAANPEKGEFILLLLGFTAIGSFGLFSWRSGLFREGSEPPPLLSLENMMAINNLVLCAIMFTILTGTLYPPLSQFFAGHILSVGKPFFDQTILPMAWPLLLFMGIAAFIPWKKNLSFTELKQKIFLPTISLFIALPMCLWLHMNFAGTFFFTASLWMISATIKSAYDHLTAEPETGNFLTILKQKQKIFYALLGHIGVGIAIIGLCGISASQGDVASLAVGENIIINHEKWQLDSIEKITAPDYQGIRAHLSIRKNQHMISVLTPERRFYLRQREAIATPAIRHQLFEDRYAVLSSAALSLHGKETFLFKLRTHPFGSWFWVGGMIAVFAVLLGNFMPKSFYLRRKHSDFASLFPCQD